MSESILERLEKSYRDWRADAMLVSFPKCGRTWLRMMMGRVMAPDAGWEGNPMELESFTGGRLPRIRVSHDDRPEWKRPEELETSKARFRGKKVLLLVRDPRDIVVSMFFQRTKRKSNYQGTIGEFLDEPIGSLSTILGYYNIWARNRDVPRLLHIIRYEDLHEDAAKELVRIFAALGVGPYAPDRVTEAVQYASFQNMRAMEVEDRFKSKRLRPGDVRDEATYKTRRGEVGGYRDYLDAAQIDAITARIRSELDPIFGYS